MQDVANDCELLVSSWRPRNWFRVRVKVLKRIFIVSPKRYYYITQFLKGYETQK